MKKVSTVAVAVVVCFVIAAACTRTGQSRGESLDQSGSPPNIDIPPPGAGGIGAASDWSPGWGQ